MMSTNKLFDFFAKVDTGDFDAISKLSATEKKALVPIVLMRWLSGTSSKSQIININHILNPIVFNLHKHQDLLLKLMIVCSDSKSKYYKWIKKEGKIKKSPLSLDVITRYYDCTIRESQLYINSLSKNDVLAMALELGDTKEMIDKLKKE